MLRDVFLKVKRAHPFEIDAIVFLPDHLHAVWTLPEGDADYSSRWCEIKKRFSKSIPKWERLSALREQKGERGIWQRRFWEHTIKDERGYRHHVDYVHVNPLKHNFVERVKDWPFSSFHRAVSLGIYQTTWCGSQQLNSLDNSFGETR